MSENNRIGSACWYHLRRSTKWMHGKIRAWSTDHDEYESGPGHFPVAVVECCETGMVHSVHVGNICFSSIPPEIAL